MSGEKIFAARIAQIFHLARRKAGIPEQVPKITPGAFRRLPGAQMGLDL